MFTKRAKSTRTFISILPFILCVQIAFSQPMPERVIKVNEFEQIFSWNYSDDGQKLAVAEKDILVLDAKTEQQLFRGNGGNSNIIKIAFSPDSNRIAADTDFSTVKIWNLLSGEETVIHTFSYQFKPTSTNVSGIVFSSKENRLWTCETSGYIQLWDLDKNQEIKRFLGSGGIPRQMEVSPDHEFILLQNLQGAEVINALNGESVQFYPFGAGAILSHDGKSFYMVRAADDAGANGPQVHRIDLRTGEILWRSPVLTSGINMYSFLKKDGRFLYTVDERINSSKLIDVLKDSVIMTFESGSLMDFANARFSKEGDKLITVNDRNLKKWDLASFTSSVFHSNQYEN